MKILLDARMINHSGIGIYIKRLVSFIHNYHSDFFFLQSLFFNSKIYSVKEQLKYPFLPKADIFWSPHFNVPLLPIRAKKRVVTIHDVYHLAYSHKLPLLQRLYSKLLIFSAVKLSDHIITVSDFSKQEIIKYTKCNPQKISVIYNGVKSNITNNFSLNTNVAKKYNLPTKYILFVGSVKPHKNLKVLIDAYSKADIEFTNQYKIVIVGKKDGLINADDDLLNLFNRSKYLQDSIRFTGFVDDEDLPTIYREASLFIFPSIYEGFGLPPLEAMSNSCPTLVANSASLPEVCGDASIYFNHFDSDELLNKIKMILSDEELKNNIVEKGLQRVKLFTWELSAEKHLNLFKNLIK